jgi:hypothetical protein
MPIIEVLQSGVADKGSWQNDQVEKMLQSTDKSLNNSISSRNTSVMVDVRVTLFVIDLND